MSVFIRFVHSQVLRGRGKFLGGFSSVVVCLILFLLSFNLSGLFPYVFRRTRHLLITFVLGRVFWFRMILRSVF